MLTDVNSESMIDGLDTERESFWGSTAVAAQVTPELPLSYYSNSMTMSVAKSVRDKNTNLEQFEPSEPNFLRHKMAIL